MFLKKIRALTTSVLIVLSIAACSLSTEDLVVEVKKSMEEKLNPEGININSLILTKKGGNVYSGVLETTEPNGNFTYSVEVIYDGNNMTWKVED